jgi:hypothetical protein
MPEVTARDAGRFQRRPNFEGTSLAGHLVGEGEATKGLRVEQGRGVRGVRGRAVGASGQFDLIGRQATTLVGCIHTDAKGAPTGQCKKVRNPEVLDVATRVQFLDGLLTFYNAEGTAIGVYHRVR